MSDRYDWKQNKSKLGTAPFDPRFPSINQTRYCYQSFIDYQRCRKLGGPDLDDCLYFKRVYQAICPNEWVKKWNEQISEKRFPGRI